MRTSTFLYQPIRRTLLLLSVLTGLLAGQLQAQTTAKTVSLMAKSIQITVNGSPKTVVALRWLPVGDTLTANSSATNYYLNAWERFKNRNGYVIERRNVATGTIERSITILPDTVALGNCARSTTMGFESEACDLLYGALYDVIDSSPGTVNGQTIEIQAANAQERPQRYSLTALGAEMSFKASRLAGLGWIDSTAVENSNYDYRIREAGTTNADTATRSHQLRILAAIVGQQAPATPLATFGDKKVTLKWRWRNLATTQLAFQKAYSNYHVEKSTTSSTAGFSRVTTKPIFSFSDLTDSLYFNTTLDTNGVTRFFRIVGRTPFDEEVNSGVVSGMGKATPLKLYPRIDSSSISTTNQAYFRWVFPSDTIIANANALIKGFVIRRTTDLANFSIISGTSLLSVSSRQFSLSNVTTSGYYVVTAVSTSNDSLNSIPVFLETIDETPPQVPTGLTATWQAATKGVKLTWVANSEVDLLGYKLFRSNLADEEPTLIADSLVNVTTFIDTLVKLDNPRAYYSILAIDKRYNHSALSPKISIRKPDQRPPARPLFKGFSISNRTIQLDWISSISTDVATYKLSRKTKNTVASPTLLKSWPKASSPQTYADTALNVGIYTYYVQAIDSTNNMSTDSIDVELLSVAVSKPRLDIFTSKADTIFKQIELRWTYDVANVVEFEILKAEGASSQLSSWKITDGSTRSIYDDNVATGKTYRYSIRALFKDGMNSNWKEISVVLQ